MFRKCVALAFATAVGLVGCADTTVLHSKTSREAVHLRIDSVAHAFGYTPDKRGLLPVLEEDVATAARHARFALRRSGEIDWLRTQVQQLRFALSPDLEPSGPGTGYGALRAAQDIASEMKDARDTPSASPQVKQYADDMVRVAAHVEKVVDDAIGFTENMLSEPEAANAAPWVESLNTALDRLGNGWDANNDGTISWEAPEAGVLQLRQILGIMMKSEGLR
ncbi:MAG: hypothetical protein AAF493_27040 [Pseudomonadota bacterium]